MLSRIPRSGEIWMCSLNSKEGSVQTGYRPVFILSNNKNNTYSHTLNIIPLTSKNKKHLPVHVELTRYEEYGLKVPSTLLVEQIMTVPVDYLDKCIGEIRDEETLHNICAAMEFQFPIMRMLNVPKNT